MAIANVISISNDFSNLVGVGTIDLFNPPSSIEIGGGLPVEEQKEGEPVWRWFDINGLGLDTSEIVSDIQFLINWRYIMATYQVQKVLVTPQKYFIVCKVRIYIIPWDVPGARYIDEWRSRRSRSSASTTKVKKIWANLLGILDYSNQGWNCTNNLSLCEFLRHPRLVVDFQNAKFPLKNENFHISRWTSNQGHFPLSESSPEPGLNGSLIQTIYDQIKSPDLSSYVDKPRLPVSRSIPTVQETIIGLLDGSHNGTVAGIKSTLYPFQIASLCKMLEKESTPAKALAPNLIPVKSPCGTSNYYFDLLTNGFFLQPDMYDLPRGGILAENMGLGKTLICLSLICLTSHEVSKPENMLLYEENIGSQSQSTTLSRLSSLCSHVVNDSSLPWRYYKDDLPETVIKTLLETPGSFRIPLIMNHYESSFVLRTRQASTRNLPDTPKEGTNYKTLLLTNSTLIIVPDNLLHQWNHEIKKHMLKDHLHILCVSTQFKQPFSHDSTAYTNELPDSKALVAFDLVLTTNSYISRYAGDLSASPLTGVYWKRIIIDEGHSLSSKVSRVSFLCKSMHCERKWAVTGTPTSGLTRLHMEQDTKEKSSKYTIKNSFNERDDLAKLGTIIGNFLKIEPFFSQPKYWNTHMVKPLERKLYGSQLKLLNLLRSILVRHNLQDIESELQLPPLHHQAIFLKPSYHNKLSVNLFTAVLAVNAVSSERKDVDYMFHPSNTPQLRRLILNLQRATFHWTGFAQEDVELLIEICEKALKKPEKYSDFDLYLLEQSLQVSRFALRNLRWRTSALLHEMNYFVQGLPQEFVQEFGMGTLENSDVGVFGAPHLHQIQEFYYKNRFMNMQDSQDLKAKLSTVSKPFWHQYWNENAKRNTEKFNKVDDRNWNTSVKDAVDTPSLIRNFEAEKGVVSEPVKREPGQVRASEILGTASAKLSYLSSRLLEHQRHKIKSLVFFEFEDSAYYLTELLDILGVNYILYATFINATERANNLTDFSSYDSANLGGVTLIMDLKLASHGLTIIAATHVYFISPVWKASVEAQAIKRSHRIGQKKSVYVETLVLKGTLEEEIYNRRSHHDDQEQEKESQNTYVIDDTGMRDYILKHKFLEHNPNETEYCPFEATAFDKRVEIIKSEDFSLLSHQDWLEDNLRKWKVYLFNQANLDKLNEIKARSKIARELNVDSVEYDESIVAEKPKPKVEGPVRKKVRF